MNMDNKTQINPNISASSATMARPNIGHATSINPDTNKIFPEIVSGTVLAGKYVIGDSLDVSTGEADLYICTYSCKQYVAKLYRRHHAIKPEVINVLKSIKSPYVASMIDTGVYNDMPFEILPYYRNGSLLGKQFSLNELKNMVIPCINEALNVLHHNDIIHKDLKPSNIMLLDDAKGVAIIDFGISSVVENGNTVLVTKTGMTPEYSAPETFRSLFLEESDYYSFGITLYELFCGYTPYKNMDAEEIARFTAVQRIPFPKEMPAELKDLISGMTYFDITNRKSKDNPNRRWTYAEVSNWHRGKKQIVPGEGVGTNPDKSIPTYTFMGISYKELPALTTAIAENWNDGKKQLYRGLLSGFFKNFNPEIAGFCMDAEEESSRSSGKEDLIFWKLLYKLHPEVSAFYWKGHIHESLPALGRDVLEKLWSNNENDKKYWDDILKEKLLSNYLQLQNSKNTDLINAISALESSYELQTKSKRDSTMHYYTMAYLLSGQKLFNVNGKQFKNVAELAAYMKELLDSSYEKFEDFCHSMIGYDDTLDAQLEAWLVSLGKRKEIDSWRKSIAE